MLTKYFKDKHIKFDDNLVSIQTFKQYEEYIIDYKSKELSDVQISKLKNKVNKNINNAGLVFVVFKSKLIANQLRESNIFEHSSMFAFLQENPKLISKAPATENDIVWVNILKQSYTTRIRQILTMIGLVMISFFLMTPTTIISLLSIAKD